MELSKDEAEAIFRDYYKSPSVTIHEVSRLPKSGDYKYNGIIDGWYVVFSFDWMHFLLGGSSRLVVISDAEKKVVYEGSAMEE